MPAPKAAGPLPAPAVGAAGDGPARTGADVDGPEAPRAVVPPALVPALRAELDQLSEEIIAAISVDVPAYRRPLSGEFGRGVRRGVTEALTRFLDVVEGKAGGERRSRQALAVYAELGRGEMRQGRALEALLSAYRVGARLAWQRLAWAALRAGARPETLVELAASVFAYIDELSAASAEGYTLEQSLRAGERERRRDALAGLLLSGSAAPATVAEAARLAGWTPPERLRAVLVDPTAAARLGPALPTGTLRAEWDGMVAALVDDVAAGRRQLDRRLAGLSAVVGPAVEWSTVARSAERAATLLRLRASGVLPDGPEPLHVEDHLAELVLHAVPDVVAELAAVRLAALRPLPEVTRLRLAQTLVVWLELRGERAKVAAVLHVHPQTVRYRLGQLRELLGADLDDPQRRFELELVLRAGHTQ